MRARRRDPEGCLCTRDRFRPTTKRESPTWRKPAYRRTALDLIHVPDSVRLIQLQRSRVLRQIRCALKATLLERAGSAIARQLAHLHEVRSSRLRKADTPDGITHF
jgi:hypothetical protein